MYIPLLTDDIWETLGFPTQPWEYPSTGNRNQSNQILDSHCYQYFCYYGIVIANNIVFVQGILQVGDSGILPLTIN